MVVLHLIDHLKAGGAQEIILNLVRYRAPGFEHHVASLYGPATCDREIIDAGGKVVVLAPRRRQIFAAILTFRSLVRQLQPDIVNLHLEYATAIGLLLRPFLGSRACWIVTLHALRAQLPGWFYPVLRQLRRQADGFVVEDRIAYREVQGIGTPTDRIAHIPIGTDYLERIGRRLQPPEGIRHEFGIPPEAPIVLNIARMHPAKGQAHLLRAHALLLQQIPAAWLIIVGYGREEHKLRQLAVELGVGERVIFAGLRRDLENFYADADIFVMPALDEAMGVVVYQAMAFGLPVVAYDVGSIREVVVDAKTGSLVPVGRIDHLATACLSLLRVGKKSLEKFGALAKERIEGEFSAEMMCRRYETFYHRREKFI